MPVIIRYICGRLCAQYVSVRGRVEMKKAAIIIVLAFAVPLCLFADKWFTMNISYTVNRTCQLQFWPANSSSDISNSTLDVSSLMGTGSAFARLGVVYTGTNVISVDLGYTPFYAVSTVNGVKQYSTSEAYPYTLGIVPQGADTSWYVSGAASSNTAAMEYQGYVADVSFSVKRIVSSKNPSQIGADIDSSKSVLADLSIGAVELENTGEYVSFLMCFLTIE